jgi:serine/threonine protein kinase
MPRLIDGFCPPGLKGYAPVLGTIPEEPTREEFTFSWERASRDRFFHHRRDIDSRGSAEGDLCVVSVLDGPEYARMRDVFENHLGVTGSFVKKDLKWGARCFLEERMGAPEVFGKCVDHSSPVLALGVVNKTSRMFSLVFDSEDLLPDDVVYYELYRLEKEDLMDVILGGRVTSALITQVARDVGGSLVGFEEEGLLHRDLKSGNILRKFDGTFEVCDFGFVTHGDDRKGLEKGCATWAYSSPETGRKILVKARGEDVSRIYQKRTDWFSLGIVLYQMVTKDLLVGREAGLKGSAFCSWYKNMQVFVRNYPEMAAKRQVLAVSVEGGLLGGKFSMEAPRLIELFPDERERAAFVDFVLGLLNPDSHERLSGKEALEHSFVTKRFEDPSEISACGVCVLV